MRVERHIRIAGVKLTLIGSKKACDLGEILLDSAISGDPEKDAEQLEILKRNYGKTSVEFPEIKYGE